jgi:inorganic pyrophosphatase
MNDDREEIDCYVLGIFEPIDEFKGKCIAIIYRLNDDEDKIIVVPDEKNYSDDAIIA